MVHPQIQGVLDKRMFGLRGIGYTRLGKIKKILKIVRFTLRSRLYDMCKCRSTQNRESREKKSERTLVKPTSTSDPSERIRVSCDVGGRRGDNKSSAWVSFSASLLPLRRVLIHYIVYAFPIILLSVCAVFFFFFSFFLNDGCVSWPQSMI